MTWIFRKYPPFYAKALYVKLCSTVSYCFQNVTISPRTCFLSNLMCHSPWLYSPCPEATGQCWAHGHSETTGNINSSKTPIWANSTPNCIYCLQKASSWDWLSCQIPRTRVIWINSWLLRQLYNSKCVYTAVHCITTLANIFKLTLTVLVE